MRARVSFPLLLVLAALSSLLLPARAPAQELTAEAVLNSIERAKRFLAAQQNADGSWSARGGGDQYVVGITSMAMMALVNSGMTADDEPVQRALKYLRSIREPAPEKTYESSLMIMALVAANDGDRDKPRILMLANRLEESQHRSGPGAGSWGYSMGGRADRSNGQFAILGLREAAQAGVPVSRRTWELAREHWLSSQNADGAWSYTDGEPSTGSMTVAGIATLAITESMLQDDSDVGRDGKPDCCRDKEPDKATERAVRWLSNHFAVGHNPGSGSWLLYYLYGLERAGRLSGRRFFGEHDWYRAGAKHLVTHQVRRTGGWVGVGGIEGEPIIGTSLALLFLSKGLSPVLINKLQYGPKDPDQPADSLAGDWNRHGNDIRNLTDLISGLPQWPSLVTWQVVDFNKAAAMNRGLEDLMQAPVLFLSGADRPEFTPQQIELLQEYLNQGGFIFAVASCQSAEFDAGFRDVVAQLVPAGGGQLKRLPAEHPIYRSEYLLDPDSVHLEGVDYGCRTAIVYSPDDIACLWNKWARYDPPKRHPQLKAMITRATQIAVNVVAYATGREPPNKLQQSERLLQAVEQDRIQRGLLQIAKLRHTGGWDAAPQALKNLLTALNQTVGLAASTQQRNLPLTDPNIYRYPLLYMHGRSRFNMNRQEREQLKLYLERGGVLFADACCGDRQFDSSFRDLMAETFPDKPLKRIPADHDLFTSAVGHNIRTVSRRAAEAANPNAPIKMIVRQGEPYLEGIEIDGRFAVIYSKYDISCALERQASVACEGYVIDDAVKIAVNVVLYSMLQDVAQ